LSKRAKLEPLAEVSISAIVEQKVISTPAPAPVSTNEAKAFIYQHESNNEPCKINGGAIDCNYNGNRACGIGQALPCQKLTAECQLSDYACQDAWFTRYMQSRYGTWENARAFWLAHKWW
jgi:hypothetical protein